MSTEEGFVNLPPGLKQYISSLLPRRYSGSLFSLINQERDYIVAGRSLGGGSTYRYINDWWEV